MSSQWATEDRETKEATGIAESIAVQAPKTICPVSSCSYILEHNFMFCMNR
ncbi:hypothetical protein IEO21_07382 [Rhodonia placenta]|uniref:Uncharacterized protein n=1 Tax=Rhodonia placenta TaxID=104341 RepID=A0A8H7NYM6_9APHY|nr:hypothetical protein IEO21_07382 [Postia placenta]